MCIFSRYLAREDFIPAAPPAPRHFPARRQTSSPSSQASQDRREHLAGCDDAYRPHDKWGGKVLLEGMNLVYWPRARKVFVDWGYRGLREVARGLGLELAVVAHPYAGVRGVWVNEASPPPEIPRVEGFKPLPKRWVVERTLRRQECLRARRHVCLALPGWGGAGGWGRITSTIPG